MKSLSTYDYNIPIAIFAVAAAAFAADVLVPVMDRDISFGSIWDKQPGFATFLNVVNQCGLTGMLGVRIGIAVIATVAVFVLSIWLPVLRGKSKSSFVIKFAAVLLICISVSKFVAVEFPFADKDIHACDAATRPLPTSGKSF